MTKTPIGLPVLFLVGSAAVFGSAAIKANNEQGAVDDAVQANIVAAGYGD